MPKRYALLVDLRRCVGCTSCQVSCKMENAVPTGYFRAKVDFADTGGYPVAKRHFFPKLCNNCDDPPCVVPCPVPGATYKRKEDGVVMVNRDLCIGCGRCVKACPYGARFLHPRIPVKNDPSKYAKEVEEVREKRPRACGSWTSAIIAATGWPRGSRSRPAFATAWERQGYLATSMIRTAKFRSSVPR